MAIYNFYFESGARAYVLHLSAENKNPATKVLRENTNAQDELIMLQKNVSLVSYTGKKDDKQIALTRIVANDTDIHFYYEEGNGDGTLIPSENNQTKLTILQSANNVILLDPSNNKDNLDVYTVNIHYKEYSGLVQVVCAPNSQTYDVVLDFGSEASQMMIYRNDFGTQPQPVELFKGCARHFYNITSIRPNEYDQQDDDTRLFRSVFFAPSKENYSSSLKTFDYEKEIVAKPSENDHLISFISRRDKKEFGKRIPNVKISYLTDVNPNGVNMKTLHRGMVMRFFYEALYHIAEDIESKQKQLAVRLTLLLPNVMCQNEVSDFVRSIQKYVDSKEFLNQIPSEMNLSIIEVRTCSESDASLLNWINKKEGKLEAGRYLIIDIGKGTTDFSVVNVKSAAQAESIFRTGFVGAGNVLSYAILDNYVTHLAGVLSRDRKKIMEKLMKAEPAMLYRLEQAIENIKRESSYTNTLAQLSRISDIDNISVETIIERIESAGPIGDDFNIISDIINRLVVKEIVGRVKNLKFDHVVLSGRAFLYELLYNEVYEDIKTIFPNVKIYYSKDEAKKGCLYGPITPIEISKFSNMVGEPQTINIASLVGTSIDVDARVESLKSRNIQNDPEKRKSIISSIVESISKTFEHIFPDDEISESFVKLVNNPSTAQDNKDNRKEAETVCSTNDIMKHGVAIRCFGPNTRFYISGNSYILSNNHVPELDQEYYIYFDGDDFYLRSDKTCWPLHKDITTSKTSDLLFESLFPYSLQLLGNDVEIPISKAVRR